MGLPNDRNNLDKLSQENEEFNDVVVVNAKETYYNNPTLKMIVAFKFVSCFCPNAKYFVKADDDVFVDMHQLDGTISNAEAKFEPEHLGSSKATHSASRSTGGFYMGLSLNNSVLR